MTTLTPILLALLPALAGTPDTLRREGTPESRVRKDALEGKAPPPLAVTSWRNTQGVAVDLAELKGKVVVLDFWGAWCAPCRRSVPHLKELYDANRDDLVVIGIHTTSRTDAMAAFIDESGMDWPLAVDLSDRTKSAYGVDGYPDYYLIDRAGKLRVADLVNTELERGVQMLLAEPPPAFSPVERAKKLTETARVLNYEIRAGGAPIGRARLYNKLLPHVDGEYFEWIADINYATEKGTYALRQVTATAADAELTPTTSMAQGSSFGKEIGYHHEFKAGKLTGRVGFENVLRNVPAPLATESSVFRLASIIDFEKGSEVSFALMEGLSGAEVARDNALAFDGFEAVQVGDEEERRAARIVHKGTDRKKRATYWIDDERRMVRAELKLPKVGDVVWRLLAVRSER